MFYHIEGTVTDSEPNLVVLDCAGVGYALNVSLNTQSAVRMGARIKLYVHEAIREDAFELYGFAAKDERRCFQMLLGISGVGPKAALSILSANTPESLAMAVLNEDWKSLTCAAGVGKKIAQRIVLELREKLGKELGAMDFGDHAAPAAAPALKNSAESDAVAALVVLGYSMPEIHGALRKLDTEGLSVEQIVKAVLRLMIR